MPDCGISFFFFLLVSVCIFVSLCPRFLFSCILGLIKKLDFRYAYTRYHTLVLCLYLESGPASQQAEEKLCLY